MLPRPTIFVGNSAGLLLGPPLGERIDRYVRIFRFNRFRVDGPYAARVGTRTTHWCCGLWPGLLDLLSQGGDVDSGFRVQGSRVTGQESNDTSCEESPIEETWCATVQGRDPSTCSLWNTFRGYARGTLRPIHYGGLSAERLEELCEAGLVAKDRWPTTGLLCLAAALDLGLADAIDLAGFWDGRWETRGEYFNPARDVVTVREHDYQAERALIDRWAAAGLVRRVTG